MREKKELNIAIGERIRHARETAGMTQERLAQMTEVSIQYISDLERGVVGASVPTIIKICDGLKVSCDYILMGRAKHESVLDRVENLSPEQQELVRRAVNLIIEAFSL